jgi:hypothetical protein
MYRMDWIFFKKKESYFLLLSCYILLILSKKGVRP